MVSRGTKLVPLFNLYSNKEQIFTLGEKIIDEL
jgi:hypothetical protein